MGFWSTIGTIAAGVGVVVAGAAIALTPVGWVVGAALGVSAATSTVIASAAALDTIDDYSRKELEESEKLIDLHTKKLVEMGDSEADVDIQRLMALCTSVENMQAKLAKDEIPPEQEVETIKAIQDGIRELRIGLVAWTSDLNPHKAKYERVIGLLQERVQNVSVAHERVVCKDITKTIEAGLADLRTAGEKLKKLKQDDYELSEDGEALLARYLRKIEGSEDKEVIEKVETLVAKVNKLLDKVDEGVVATEKAVAAKDAENAVKRQEEAQEAKEKADKAIIDLIRESKNLKEHAPPSTFSAIAELLLKSTSCQDKVNDKIKPVLRLQVEADLAKRKKRGGLVDHHYINGETDKYLDKIAQYYKQYNEFKDSKGAGNVAKARYHASWAKCYLDLAQQWMHGATSDGGVDNWVSTSLNFAGFVGNFTKKEGLGGKTANQRNELNKLAPHVNSAVQLSAIAHESRFKGEMNFAFAVIGNTAQTTSDINLEIAKTNERRSEKEREEEKEKARIAEEQEKEKARIAEEARLQAIEDARQAEARKAEEAQAQAEEQVRLKAEADSRLKAEAEAKDKEKEDWAKGVALAKAEQEQQEQKRELKAEELEPEKKKVEANDSVDLPSVPTGALKGEKTEVEKAESSTEDDLGFPSVSTHQGSKHQDEMNPPLSEAMRNALSKRVKEDQAEKESALALGIGESVYTGIKRTKEEKQAKAILDSLQVEKERRLREEEIEERLKRSGEAYKEWSGLSVDAIKGRFKEYAEAFYRVYSSDDGKFKGSNENIKALDKLLNNDLGLYRVHSFLSTWSSLGLARKPQKPISDQEGVLQRLDTLYRKCLIALRENNQYTDELLVLADKGKAAVTSHAFEVLENDQKTRAIGISNFLKEAKRLNKKLPKECDAFTASESYIGKIRSELQKVNTKVEQVKNALKLLGLEGFEAMDARTSFPLIKDSEEILEAGYNFPALSGLTPTSEVDPEYSQLFDIFIEDFHKDIKSYLSKSEEDLSKSEEDKRYPMIADISVILNIMKDVERLSPLSSVSKIINKEGGDPSSMLDYEKIGHGSDSSLPADLDERFKKLSRFKGWVQLPPAPEVRRIETLPPPDVNLARVQKASKAAHNFIKLQDLCRPPEGEQRVAISSDGIRRMLSKGETPKDNERVEWAEQRFVHIPCMDTGDVFNGTMGKKRRIFKVWVRVINTADIEVGILGFPLMPVEELIGTPKTGEFEVLVPSDTSINPVIVISQKTGASFCLTSITAHMQIEG